MEEPEHACHGHLDGCAYVQVEGHLALRPGDLSLKLLCHRAYRAAKRRRLKALTLWLRSRG